MSFKKSLLSIAIIATAFLAPFPANATTIEFTGNRVGVPLEYDYNYSAHAPWQSWKRPTLKIGHSETINLVDLDPTGDPTHVFHINGHLAPNSKITFTLNSTGYNPTIGSIGFMGFYDYVDFHDGGSQNFGGFHVVDSYPGDAHDYDVKFGTVNGVKITPLVFAAAQVSAEGPSKMTAFIRNESGGALDFIGEITKYFEFADASATLTYEVTATPIPAALPMFALGLAGIVTLRRRKKIS